MPAYKGRRGDIRKWNKLAVRESNKNIKHIAEAHGEAVAAEIKEETKMSDRGMGFSSHSTMKKINNNSVLQITLKKVMVGDALICVRRALDTMKLKFKEVTTVKMFNGQPEEVPFVHHTSDSGIDIPYGTYEIEGIGRVQTEADSRNVIPELQLLISFMESPTEGLWDKLHDQIWTELQTHDSIFLGKAIKVEKFNDLIVPNYIDVSTKLPIFLNEDVEDEVESSVYFPITHSQELAKAGVNPKCGVLLHGKYGTGKSLIAREAARRSVEKGRTFILCRPGMLQQGTVISRFMMPSTLFIEDMEENSGNSSMLSLLRNTLSGIEDKAGMDVTTILSTNFLTQVEETDRSLLRPDRIDAIIEVPPPTASTVKRIVTHFGEGWIDFSNPAWEDIYKEVAHQGCTPAVITEIIRRSKIYSFRTKSKVTPDLFMTKLSHMARQIELANPEPPKTDTPARRLATAMKDTCFDGMVD